MAVSSGRGVPEDQRSGVACSRYPLVCESPTTGCITFSSCIPYKPSNCARRDKNKMLALTHFSAELNTLMFFSHNSDRFSAVATRENQIHPKPAIRSNDRRAHRCENLPV